MSRPHAPEWLTSEARNAIVLGADFDARHEAESIEECDAWCSQSTGTGLVRAMRDTPRPVADCKKAHC